MYRLTTARLVLEPLVDSDLDELAALSAEPTFWHYPFGRGMSRDETAAFLERTQARYRDDGTGVLAVRRHHDATLLGWAGLAVPHFLPEILPAVEVGWRFGREFWGNGFATEAAAAALDYAFEQCELTEIVSIFQPENVASGAVMDRLGITLERRTPHPVSGVELAVRSISKADWLEWRERLAYRPE